MLEHTRHEHKTLPFRDSPAPPHPPRRRLWRPTRRSRALAQEAVQVSPAKVSGNPCFVSHPRREPHRRNVLRARAGGTTLSCEPDPGPAHAGICGEGVHQGGYPRAGVGVFESVPSLVPSINLPHPPRTSPLPTSCMSGPCVSSRQKRRKARARLRHLSFTAAVRCRMIGPGTGTGVHECVTCAVGGCVRTVCACRDRRRAEKRS